MTSKLHQLSVYFPPQQGRAIKAKAISAHGSIGGYLKFLIEQDQASKPDPLREEIERLHKRIDEVLEFSRYMMVVQNATADRVSPGLVKEVQELYKKQFEGTPSAE